MKYAEQRQLAVAWINGARNPDSGWGLNPKQASSIVNTAEAAYVLGKLSSLPQDVQKTVQFLRQALADHPAGRGFFTRYFAFGIVGLLALGVDRSDPSIQACADALRQSQINAKGWSQVLHDQSPRVFPTFLALWTLQMIEEQPGPQTLNGLNWLLTIPKGDGGWGFTDDPNEASNAACTAYALLVLRKVYITDQRVQRGKQWLLDHEAQWLNSPIIGEAVAGTDWYHCSPVWASSALLELGESVFSTAIRGTLVYFQKLFDAQTGGWRQSSLHVTNVRSIFWAILALEAIRERLDLNDVTEAQVEESQSRRHSAYISLSIRRFSLSMPKAAFAPVILGISGICVLLYAAVLSQPHNVVIISLFATKIGTTIVLAAASALLAWKYKESVKTLSSISIALLASIVVSIWLLDNALFINFLNIIAFLLGLAQMFSLKEQ